MSSCWGPDVASPPLSPPCMCVATLASCRWHTDAQLEGRVCALSQQWGQPCTGVGTCLCRAVGAPQLLWGSWGPGVWCLTLKQPGRPGVAKGVGPGPSSGRGWAGSREGLWLGWRWGTWGPVERPEKSACGGEAAELPCRVVPWQEGPTAPTGVGGTTGKLKSSSFPALHSRLGSSVALQKLPRWILEVSWPVVSGQLSKDLGGGQGWGSWGLLCHPSPP